MRIENITSIGRSLYLELGSIEGVLGEMGRSDRRASGR